MKPAHVQDLEMSVSPMTGEVTVQVPSRRVARLLQLGIHSERQEQRRAARRKEQRAARRRNRSK